MLPTGRGASRTRSWWRAPLLGALLAAAHALAAPPPPAAAQPASSAIRGVVVNQQTRTPVEGAVVSLRFTGRSARADTAGQFALLSLDPGPGLLQVRAIGYKLGSWAVRLAAGDTLADTLEMEPIPVRLGDVVVTAPPSTDWRSSDAFELRRSRGGGYFVTEEQLRQQHPASLVEVLRTVPGVNTQCDYFQCRVWMSRSTRGCAPEYFLDGYPATFATGPDFPVEHIRGIEVYPDAFSAPIQLQRLNLYCGVIAIWTRMDR